MKRTISQTPAPKKDRVYGSKVNESGSAKSSQSANDIKLADKTINSIKSILEEHKDKSKKEVPLNTAKAVVRRGMGAYSSTHRPTISGGKPNSRVAWGLARLNAFLYKIKNGHSKSGKYSQDNDLIKELGYKVSKYNKGGNTTDENSETYKKWKSLVNMTYNELKKFYESKEGKEAGLSSKEADNLGIKSGRESARWIMKMKQTNKEDWTPTMWGWARRQISFISRMSGNKGPLYDDKGNKTRKHTSLLIWGHNPKK